MFISKTTVAAELKKSTSKEHTESETVLLSRLFSLSSAHDYASILKTFYGFYFPLQIRIFHHISHSRLPDIDERQSASLILNDLAELGLRPDFIALCELIPAIRSEAEAFGALYVLEGSTLGARQIKKMLMTNDKLQIPENATRFFTGYGSDTPEKWKSFLDALNKHTEVDEILSTAKETFTLFTNWITKTIA